MNEPDSILIIIRELQDFSRSPKANVRLVTINLLLSFCKQSKGTHQEYIDDLLRIAINLLNDDNEEVLNTAWDCVDIIIKVAFSQRKEMNRGSTTTWIEFRIWISWNYRNVCRSCGKHCARRNRAVENAADSSVYAYQRR